MRDLSKGKSIAVLVSGGADSAVLLRWAIKRYRNIYPVYVRQGYRWEGAEIYWLKKFLNRLAGLENPAYRFQPKTMDSRDFQVPAKGNADTLKRLVILEAPMGDILKNYWALNGKGVPGKASRDSAVYLPGRNLFLFSKTAAFCTKEGIGAIAVGTLSGNPFADAKRDYFRGLEKILRQSLHFNVRIKSPFARWSKEDVLRYGRGLPLYLTFSCLNPKGIKPCGRCNKCAERGRVFGSMGL